ncbi:MAG: phosphatase PAP2 family protein, partial [Planctomycetia bacterium]|nr:phosphatase PAP2 family protein [Planctomycetia bacterium]
PPPLAARHLAIVHAAMFDAVNSIHRTHQPYYVKLEARADALPDVAIAVAAHRSLYSLYPNQVERLDAALDRSLRPVPDGPAKQESFRLGRYVAEQVLAWRERDGAAQRITYTPRQGIGAWQPTPPAFRTALAPHWPSVTCFCMKSGSQFRPAAPPAVGSAAYWADFREVRDLGGVRSQFRTPEQTEIAKFWADDAGTATPPGHWNQIAQAVARERGLTTPENARLFALLNLALADAGIVSWDCKYHFHYWRPIQGIRLADPWADADRRGDPNWTPLLNTPPFPSYTSGHSTFSSAAAAVLADFFGTDQVRFTSASDGLPGTSRSFNSFSAAAREAGRSRIYGGIHWEFDNTAGLATGQALGEYVSRNYLRSRFTPAVREEREPGPGR